MTRGATTFHPSTAVGSDKPQAAPRGGSDTAPLINQLTAKDWRDSAVPATALSDHKLTITDIEKDKATIVDKKSTEEDRAKAAAELYESGIKEFKYKDAAGVEKTFKLEEEVKDGKKSVKVDDGNGFETSFEYVQDEHGNWHFVPKESAGGPQGKGGGSHAPEAAHGGHDGGHAGGGGGGSSGGGGGGGGGERVPRSRPSGMNYSAGDANGVGSYHQPGGGAAFNPNGADSHVWQGVKNTDGSVAISFKGCQVDTDGTGARNHPEDATRQSQTSLRLSNGESLNTDRDNFFVLPPSVAKAYHIKKGDLGWLVDEKSGKAVPVVFGDAGPEGKLGEASVHALKSLGFSDVSGRNGVDKSQPFKVVFVPGSGDGTGDIASDPKAMAVKLNGTGATGNSTIVA